MLFILFDIEVVFMYPWAVQYKELLDGSIDEGMITFVTRKGLLGKRDYITLKAAIDVDGTKLSVLGRPKYRQLGSDSLRRIENWLSALNRLYRG